MILDVDSIVAEATERTGVEKFRFVDDLAALAEPLATEARLSAAGQPAVRGALVGALATQARHSQLRASHPEIDEVAVDRPIIVTGMLRTGTTLVHNLLAEHPDLRAPALWELMNPAGEERTDAEFEGLADAAQAYVDEYYRVAPDLPSIHFLDARRPDECHRLTGVTFQTMVYEMRYRIPSYAAGLASRDLTESYAYHRELTQDILWRRPGGTAVFKDPFHLWSLEALTAVYPDARIIWLHRDPAVTVPSTCSLCVAVRVARTDDIDRAEIGRHWFDQIGRAIDVRADVRAALPAGAVLDVRYADLVADPLHTMGVIGDFAGAPPTAEAERRMRRYLAANARHKHGVHRYTAADFGLSDAALADRFADYRDEFELQGGQR